jgi:hypothetical protein
VVNPRLAGHVMDNSPAYREAREHRFRGARYSAVIGEGLG